MTINSIEDIKNAYEHIGFLNEFIRQAPDTPGTEKAKEMVQKTKRLIREYNNRVNDRHIVKDYGMDGYLELIEFPDGLVDPEAYFEENEQLSLMHSAYDCTGQAFSGWHKIFKRNGKTICYHRVCCDV